MGAGGDYRAKDLAVLTVDRRKRLIDVIVEFDDAPGRLRELLQVFPYAQATILRVNAGPGSGPGKVSVHLHLQAEAALDIPGVERQVRALPYVHEVAMREGIDGILVDGSFPLRLTERSRGIVLDAARGSDMLSLMRERLGTGGSLLLYELGVGYGQSAGRAYVRFLGAEFLRTHPHYAIQLFTALGWGELSLTAYDPTAGRATIVVQKGFECESRESTQPYSQFMRGCLAGVASAIIGFEVECEEVKCVSMGDPACEFSIHPSSRNA